MKKEINSTTPARGEQTFFVELRKKKKKVENKGANGGGWGDWANMNPFVLSAPAPVISGVRRVEGDT